MKATEISLLDGRKFIYKTATFNATNPLGVTKAVLKEFILYAFEAQNNIICKLYKTDENCWYDLDVENSPNISFLTSIKIAIDKAEKFDDAQK